MSGYAMQDWTPSGKVTAAGIAGAGVFLLIIVLNQYVGYFARNPISGPLASGLPFFASMLAAYFTKPTDSDVARVTFKESK